VTVWVLGGIFTIFSKFGFGVGLGISEWGWICLVETFPTSYRSLHSDTVLAFIFKSVSSSEILKGTLMLIYKVTHKMNN